MPNGINHSYHAIVIDYRARPGDATSRRASGNWNFVVVTTSCVAVALQLPVFAAHTHDEFPIALLTSRMIAKRAFLLATSPCQRARLMLPTG